MSDRKPWRRYGGALGLVATGLVAGGVLAGTVTAGAVEDTTSGAESSTTRSAEDSRPSRGDEEPLTGDVLAQVEAAVLAEYPDATIERSETDAGGVYESHVVTAGGERLTVLVGEDFTVTGTETGGRGGGGRGGGGECDEDDAPTTAPSTEEPAEEGTTTN